MDGLKAVPFKKRNFPPACKVRTYPTATFSAACYALALQRVLSARGVSAIAARWMSCTPVCFPGLALIWRVRLLLVTRCLSDVGPDEARPNWLSVERVITIESAHAIVEASS
jgi:hypothetical protein